MAGYDLALHRHLATGIGPARAGRAGFAAIAIAQTVGMGVVSGAFIRWRMLPELGLWGAMRLSLAVAASFLLAWAVLSSDRAGPGAGHAPGHALAPLVLGLSLAWPCVLGQVFPRPWMPNLITLSRLFALATVDCVAAGLALWLLLPGEPGFVLSSCRSFFWRLERG